MITISDTDKMSVCARIGCEERFVKRTHNMIYHDSDCCRLATNERLKGQYHERQAQKRGEPRYCVVCGVTRLNRYNSGRVCGGCQAERAATAKSSLVGLLSNVELELV